MVELILGQVGAMRPRGGDSSRPTLTTTTTTLIPQNPYTIESSRRRPSESFMPSPPFISGSFGYPLVHLSRFFLGSSLARSFRNIANPWTILEILVTSLARGFRNIVVGLLCFLGVVFFSCFGFSVYLFDTTFAYVDTDATNNGFNRH